MLLYPNSLRIFPRRITSKFCNSPTFKNVELLPMNTITQAKCTRTSVTNAAIRKVCLFDEFFATSYRPKMIWSSSTQGVGKSLVVPNKRLTKRGKKTVDAS